jgi:D-hydroxyproline dehydrogenase subunit gamma
VTKPSSAYRIQDHTQRGDPFSITVNDQKVTAYPGETLATAILASGRRVFRHTSNRGEPRGLYCGMGICYECMVILNGRANVRSCQTIAQPGDIVECPA